MPEAALDNWQPSGMLRCQFQHPCVLVLNCALALAIHINWLVETSKRKKTVIKPPAPGLFPAGVRGSKNHVHGKLTDRMPARPYLYISPHLPGHLRLCSLSVLIHTHKLTMVHMPCHEIQDDVIKWNHFPHYWPFVRGIQRLTVNSPHKGQWRGALMFSLICAWMNGWVNNREAGDLRCHRDHYDVIVTKSRINSNYTSLE